MHIATMWARVLRAREWSRASFRIRRDTRPQPHNCGSGRPSCLTTQCSNCSFGGRLKDSPRTRCTGQDWGRAAGWGGTGFARPRSRSDTTPGDCAGMNPGTCSVSEARTSDHAAPRKPVWCHNDETKSTTNAATYRTLSRCEILQNLSTLWDQNLA